MTPTRLIDVWRMAVLTLDGIPALRMRQRGDNRIAEFRLDSCHVIQGAGKTWEAAFEALCDKLKALVEGSSVRQLEMAGGF